MEVRNISEEGHSVPIHSEHVLEQLTYVLGKLRDDIEPELVACHLLQQERDDRRYLIGVIEGGDATLLYDELNGKVLVGEIETKRGGQRLNYKTSLTREAIHTFIWRNQDIFDWLHPQYRWLTVQSPPVKTDSE